MRRKKICFLMTAPEKAHGRRLLNGLAAQCLKYGYDAAVFAVLMNLTNQQPLFAEGEENILELPAFDAFDGILLDTIGLTEDYTGQLLKRILSRLEKKPHGPVVCLGIEQPGFPCVPSDNSAMLRQLCRHVVLTHGKTNVLLLTGPQGHPEAEERKTICRDELAALGVELPENRVAYGDFWFAGGEKLADEIFNGLRPLPEAVISTSDFMALGLIERLTAHGIRVPEDIIVVSFDAVKEIALGEITLTSIESNFMKTAADGVDALRRLMEPGAEIQPYLPDVKTMFHPGASCGCAPDLTYMHALQHSALYYTDRNYTPEVLSRDIDVGMLTEEYLSETLVHSESPAELIENIYKNVFMLAPFQGFYLCLRENWLNIDADQAVGYPERMKLSLIHENGGWRDFCEPEKTFTFSTEKMLPALWDSAGPPMLYLFSAVHFREKMLGYAVLKRQMEGFSPLTVVYRNWLRIVNTALEMVRIRNRFQNLSTRDAMTGLYNRRGMMELFELRQSAMADHETVLVCMIDMDGLKTVNDHFGHQAGDEALMALSRAVQSVCGKKEAAIRGGGDEFIILGTGPYQPQDAACWEEKVTRAVEKENQRLQKPYALSASVGAAIGEKNANLDALLTEADQAMYRHKIQRKMQRNG